MSEYTPDSWVVLHIKRPEELYKVLAGWSGGYLDGDSWRMNSGIVSVEEDEHSFRFYGATGSCYSCSKHGYGLRMSTSGVYNKLKEAVGDDVILLDEETNWTQLDWKIDVPMSKRID